MSQPNADDHPEGRAGRPREEPAEPAVAVDPDPNDDDVRGHAFTGALQDKNQQP